MQNSTIRRSNAGVRISRPKLGSHLCKPVGRLTINSEIIDSTQPPISNWRCVEGHIFAGRPIDYPASSSKLWMNCAIIMPRWISPATPLLVPTKERRRNKWRDQLVADMSSPSIARRLDLSKQPQPTACQQELCKQPPTIVAHCEVAHFSGEHDIVSCRPCGSENVKPHRPFKVAARWPAHPDRFSDLFRMGSLLCVIKWGTMFGLASAI